MNSMTGYGRAVVEAGPGERLIVEVSSVNRKQTDIALSLPKELSALEPDFRELATRRIARGRININVQWHSRKSSAVVVDEQAAAEVFAASERLAEKLQLAGGMSVDALLRAPGVIREVPADIDLDDLKQQALSALDQAFTQMEQMRATEGASLERDFRARVESLRDTILKIRSCAEGVPSRHREAMHARLAKMGLPINLDDERLVREIGLLADRSDVTEELTRLDSHLAQFCEQLDAEGAVGRTLEFINQEIFRELNTIGTKAGHADISRFVVDAKSELERIREQVANVE